MTTLTMHRSGCCAPSPVHATRLDLSGVAPADRARQPRRGTPSVDKAELLVTGPIVTMDETRPRAEAVAVAHGRILAVGTRAELEGLVGPGTRVLDHARGAILPGFVEPHMHLLSSALVFSGVDCSTDANASRDEVLVRLKSALAAAPGTAVIGQRYDPSLMPGNLELTADLLDQVSTEVPVVVMNASQHYFYVNSAAYRAAGITASTVDPAGGSFGIVDGTLTGIVAESSAMIPFVKVLPPMTQESIVAQVTGIARLASSAGVTMLNEAATGALAGAAELDLLHGACNQDDFPVRATVAVWGLNLDAFTTAGVTWGSGDDRLRSQFVKWVSDGSNQGYTGFQRQPYLNRTTRGEADFTPDELQAHFAATVAAGWPIMVHANGDAAIDMVVAAFQATARLPGWDASKRHRVEHSSLLHDEHISAMASLRVTPSFLMNHVRLWGHAMRDEILGPERAGLLHRVASTVNAGLPPSFHSDFSVSPIQPLSHVATAAADYDRGWSSTQRGRARLGGPGAQGCDDRRRLDVPQRGAGRLARPGQGR